MINILITKNKNNIVSLQASGHADFAQYGQDIVCSAVSSLVFCIANALLKASDKNDVVQEENVINLKHINDDHDSQLLTNTLIEGLSSIQQQYPQCIKIMEV